MKKIITIISLISISCSSHSAISLDRTRAIFDQENKSISLFISNKNDKLPYLAQAWIENKNGEKINEPFIITPPLQRLEPSSNSQIKIQLTPNSKLENDKESMFYLNLREIPPKSELPNTLQLSLQTKIKLFYRPSILKVKSGEKPWQNDLQINLENGIKLINPTPYYIVITDFKDSNNNKILGFSTVNLEPKSDFSLENKANSKYDSFKVTYVNDFGGSVVIDYICKNNICKSEKKSKN